MHTDIAKKFIEYLSEYGRWDDLFILFGTNLEEKMYQLIKWQLALDMNDCLAHKGISLLAKWLPSENAHSNETKKKAISIRKYLGLTSKQYRQMLSKLRAHLNVLERLMSANRWDEIEFDKIPSKAGLIYRNAFARRDMIAKKYEAFAKDKNTKVNAGTLYPYEVVEKVTSKIMYDDWYLRDESRIEIDDTERAMINKYWENLPDYLNGADPSMLCVIDTSGSMRGRPMDMAISLGLYCAERMTGPFAGKYISFSSYPQLIKTEGVDFIDKVERIYKTNLCENTNLNAVFDLMLLNIAVKKKLSQKDLPSTIVVISDMEIDYMSNWRSEKETSTQMQKIKEKWKIFGYEVPKLVFWNVSARHDTILDVGPDVSLVSGSSPVIFEQVLTGKTGFELMLNTLLSERYKDITVK